MEKKQKIILLRIVLATLLLLLVLIIPLHGIWKFAAFLLPYLIVGYDVLFGAVKNIVHGEVFDEEFLMSAATIGAFALGEYPEAVAVMLFYQLGELFGDYAEEKCRKSITALMALRPDTAQVLRGGELSSVPVEQVAVGETVLVRPGDRIPLDGIVSSGTTSVDTSALTGESLPRDLNVGDIALSGCINLSGRIEITVSALPEESTAAKILALIEDAADRKSKSETFIRKFARIYTPCVVFGAVLLALLPPLFDAQWLLWLQRALIFLVASCPCALVVSVPLTFFGGIGAASKKGILIKGADYLERTAALQTVIFDKTGTLTRGCFTVSDVRPVSCSKEELLSIAATAERSSSHPIAACLVNAAEDSVPFLTAEAVTEHSGHGIEAVIGGKTYFVGNEKLMARARAHVIALPDDGTAVYVSQGAEFLGGILISDTLKADAAQTVKTLQHHGLKTVMLTGDWESIAKRVASQLRISDYYAQLLPEDKVKAVMQLAADGVVTAFVGDGINDAPVLMQVDVGIAMGAFGSDAAIEAADIVLLNDALSGLDTLYQIARKVMRIVRENLFFALTAKLLVLLLSGLGVIGQHGMWIAVFADVGVLVLSVLNALRTFFVKP